MSLLPAPGANCTASHATVVPQLQAKASCGHLQLGVIVLMVTPESYQVSLLLSVS